MSLNTPDKRLDLTVLIATRNRAESLREVLACFIRERSDDIRFEIVVVDNGGSDDTQAVVTSFSDTINIRYLLEDRPGKCHALNRALEEIEPGEIVAVLDDDMTLEHGWVRAVVEGCRRWPDYDIFSGRSTVTFPKEVTIPAWAHRIEFAGWAFSVVDTGTEDHAMPRGFYPSGNHFWVRSRVFESNRRFPDLKILSDAGFVLALYEDGFKGMWIGSAIVRHHIQPHLLEPTTLLKRMRLIGVESPYVWMPNHNLSWQARMFRDHPYVWISLSCCNTLRWLVNRLACFTKRDAGDRLLNRMKTTIRLYDHIEIVRHWKQIRHFVESDSLRGKDRKIEDSKHATTKLETSIRP